MPAETAAVAAPARTPIEPDRAHSGIPGLDDLLNGGIPRGNLVVVSGDPGSGKTSFCLSFLYWGIVKFNEPGVYISLEESEDEIIKEAAYFGWDLAPLVRQRKLAITLVSLYDFDKLKNAIEDAVERIGAKRIVIDPGVVFRMFFEKELEARKTILALGRTLKKIGATTLITNELSLDKLTSLYGLEEYVADGVILLYHTKLENRFIRSIGILKMRGTKTSEKLHPVEIEASGLRVLSKQELFEEL